MIRSAWCLLLLGVGLVQVAAAASQPPAFSVSGVQGWSVETFMDRAQTHYQLVKDGSGQVLQANCNNSASGMIWKGKVDLQKTPILHWRWKIARIYPGLDERTKAGDDFPARVYVVTGTRWLPWTIRSLSYVWSSSKVDAPWWNSPYTGQARMVPVESGSEYVGQWRSETRDVGADFKRVFGDDVKTLGAVAVMSDCDDSHNHGEAWYGDLRFTAR